MQESPTTTGAWYSVFGLLLRSNIAIPGLTALAPPTHEADVSVELAQAHEPASDHPARAGAASEAVGKNEVQKDDPETLFYTSVYTDDSGEPILRIFSTAEGGMLRVAYPDGMQFWLDRAGENVWGRWPEELSLGDAASCLMGPILGLLLRLRGLTCLHASAVAIGGRAVLFSGAGGAGKSTTAAMLARRGHAVLADDICVVIEREESFLVRAAYPYLSLWPDSAEMIYGAEHRLPAFSANFDKRMARSDCADGLRFETEPVALGAIFVLGERSDDPGAPLLEAIDLREGLLSLVVNSYATNLLSPEMRAKEFSQLGRLMASVPVHRVRAHSDPGKLEQLGELIENAIVGRGPRMVDNARD